jgi:hypothetical protein
LIDVHSHLLYAQRRIEISQGLLMDVPNHLLYAQRRVQISNDSWWMFLTFSYMCSAEYKSARGFWLTSLTISYIFYTRIAANKKQGTPDRRSIQLLLLLARTSPSFQKFLQLIRYYHRWFGSTANPASASPSIHRNVREQMSTRSSSIMIGHIDPDQLISFIDWQRINRLHIMMEELTRENLPPTISTQIQNFCTWYI